MILFNPKILEDVHIPDLYYAYRGQNQIAWRFGKQIKVICLSRKWGPFFTTRGEEFFDFIGNFKRPGRMCFGSLLPASPGGDPE